MQSSLNSSFLIQTNIWWNSPWFHFVYFCWKIYNDQKIDWCHVPNSSACYKIIIRIRIYRLRQTYSMKNFCPPCTWIVNSKQLHQLILIKYRVLNFSSSNTFDTNCMNRWRNVYLNLTYLLDNQPQQKKYSLPSKS